MALVLSYKIQQKLEEKHGVSRLEVVQCVSNRTGELLIDRREEHSDPPTLWFIALTNKNRLLKICFVQQEGDQYIRTAYEPNERELQIYRLKGKPSDF